jgi:hypothetical protein
MVRKSPMLDMFRGWASVLLTVSLCMGAAPTPQQIVTSWASLSGGKDGKVVYGWNTQIYVLDLKTGNAAVIANWDHGTTDYGVSCCYRWSSDGRRIMVQNPDSVSVLNADGTNLKTIARVHQCSDLIWGDWDGSGKIVYSTGPTVVRTAINADNTAGATETLVSEQPVHCWSSVTIDGNYLAYNNIQGNKATGGFHQPRMMLLPNGPTVRLVRDDDDGCQLAMLVGHGGEATYMHNIHTVPSDIADFTAAVVGHIPQPTGCGTDGKTLCAQIGHAWSNDSDYFINGGDKSSWGWAWVRKFSTMDGFMVSNTMYWPDLYVGAPTGVRSHTRLQGEGGGTRTVDSRQAIAYLRDHAASGVRLFNAAGIRIGASMIGDLPAGMYMVDCRGCGRGADEQVRFAVTQ